MSDWKSTKLTDHNGVYNADRHTKKNDDGSTREVTTSKPGWIGPGTVKSDITTTRDGHHYDTSGGGSRKID